MQDFYFKAVFNVTFESVSSSYYIDMSELNIPGWLSTSYFQEILSRKLKNTSVKVKEVLVEQCGATDGFLSTMWRVRVNYFVNSKDENESFVVKMATSNEMAIQKVGKNGFDVQNKEMSFFEVFAPQMKKILRLGDDDDDDDTLFPNVISVDRHREVIVLEDLKARDFVMVDRMKGLDEVHVRLALKKLAQFQAASLMIYQKHPKAFDSFDMGIFNRKVDAFNGAYLSIFDFVVEEVETWPGFESYIEKMRKLKGSLIENTIRCFDNEPGDFCVFNHGDVWTNNLMFTYNESGEVNDAIMVRSCKPSTVFKNLAFRLIFNFVIGVHRRWI